MTLFLIIFCVPAVAYLFVQVWQTSVLIRYKDQTAPEPESWPEITVMIAARNEEENIAACLQALKAQHYPADKMHIVVGNDQSTDRTAEIAAGFKATMPNLEVIDIRNDDSGLKAKARVMAQMDQFARGDYYLVTDADVVVKPDWAAALVRHMRHGIGVASGTTMVKGTGIWGHMQEIDWAYFMGLLNIISYSGVPATAVGNNMIIREDAYWQTGGYGAIRFSITEDYKLYSEVCRYGWKWDNIMTPEVLAYSRPVRGFLPLLHQRKRWLSGGKELPWYWWILFALFALFYFVVPVIFCFFPWTALLIWAAKFGLQTFQISRIYRNVGEKAPGIIPYLIYEMYLFGITISTAFFFLAPIRTVWKGRMYNR